MKQRFRRPMALLLAIVLLLGLLPATALAADTAEVESLILKDFVPHGETTAQNVDLLQSGTVQWDIFSPYTLEVKVSLPAGQSNTMDLTLENGIKFVGLVPETIGNIDGVESAEWKKPAEIYGKQPENGTLHVVFDQNTTAFTLSVSVQPDTLFFPIECVDSGFLISDAITVTLNGTKAASANVNVLVNTDAQQFRMTVGDRTQALSAAPGDTLTLNGNLWAGWLTYNGIQYRRLMDYLTVTLSVPNSLVVGKTSGSVWEITKGETDPANSDNTLYTFTLKGEYTVRYQMTAITIDIPRDASPETTYSIVPTRVAAKTYGQANEYSVNNPTNGSGWTITVKDPKEVEITLTAGNAANVYDYTKGLAGGEQGEEPFEDYHTSFAGAKLTNDGVSEISEALVYEATFGQAVQFVTAVGIPCGWSSTEDTYMPTCITVTDEAGDTYTLTDPDAMRQVATLSYANYGFILRAEDIPDYNTGNSIQSVKVELPGLPRDYQSGGNSLTEGGTGANSAYAGVWGRVRAGRTGDTDTNTFSVYWADQPDTPLNTNSTTTVKETGTIASGVTIGTITVDGEDKSAASGGEVLHIRQSIRPNSNHTQFHTYETILYDPVVYLLQPPDLTIENVCFTANPAVGNISYTRTDITAQHSNLPAGYKLYQYRLSDTLLLGWWDGDWTATTLYVDFDYRVSPAAQTSTYSLKDLIFYKSSLNLEFNSSFPNQYGLNGNNQYIGGVYDKTFAVNALPSFNIAAAIQIDGEDSWYTYDPDDEAATTAVFTDGAVANVKVTISNNSGADAQNATVYIPVPKKDGHDLGAAFISQAGFDMYVAGEADTTDATGWTVQYGTVKEVTYDGQGVPTGAFTLDDDWNSTYSKETNMIKLDLSGTMYNNTRAEIILQLKASADPGQTDSSNIFKSWWKYETETVSQVDAGKTYNFGALLQNGKLTGTVYADTDRDGVRDAGEAGVSGVTVRVTDEDGRNYETKTSSDGAYTFASLPGNQELTVTVINPSSPEPNNTSGSYRFSPVVPSAESTTGSDVTAAADNRFATKDLTLSGGTATVNAGLIAPYTVTFRVDQGTGGYVTPSSRKIYAGQKLGDVIERVTVTPPVGQVFQDSWTKSPGDTTVDHGVLLSETVTADTTYTAQTQVSTSTVKATWWDADSGDWTSDTWTVSFGGTVPGTGEDGFPEDGAVNGRPGYAFTGWEVNGESSPLKTRADIVAAAVYADVNYRAHYEPKADISVTLNANGGSFPGGGATLTLSGLTYGGYVTDAAGYQQPAYSGKYFAGWSASQDGSDQVSNLPVPAESGKTFYAVWSDTSSENVTVSFDRMGGDWTQEGESKYSAPLTGGPGTPMTPPTADDITRYGYIFAGWYTDSACENSAAESDGSYRFPTTNATWYAKWTAKDVTVVFDYDGGKVGDESQKQIAKPFGSNLSADDIPAPTLAGSTLTGWRRADGTIIPSSNMTSEVIRTEGAVTYTAYYTANPITITFDPNGGTFPDGTPLSKSYMKSEGDTMPFADVPVPTQATKDFVGWKLQNSDDSTAATTGSITFDAAKTYVAVWTDTEYTITFRLNGGNVSGSTDDVVESVSYGAVFPAVPAVTLSGSTLQGWMNTADGRMYGSSPNVPFPTTVTESATYIAVWVGDVTVSFVLNGGEITNDVPASVTGAPGTAITVPLVTWEGHTFDGWYDAETGGKKVEFENNETTIGDTSVTYYAYWTQNSLTVEPEDKTVTYTGTPEDLAWTVKDDQGALLATTDYDVTYFNQATGVVTVNKVPTEAGTYTVTFRGKGSYQGKTATAAYTIERADLSGAVVTVAEKNKTYNGQEQYASVTVTRGSTSLIMGRDFTVSYGGDCVDAGSYSITVTGIGNYQGKATATDELVIAPKNLENGMIQAIPPQYYTGQEITPKITVHDGALVLREGIDFENVDYSANTEVGTADVTITGKGNYTGTAAATFYIIPRSAYLEVSVNPASATCGDDLSGIAITVTADGTALKEGKDYQLSYQRYNQSGEPETVSGIDEAGVYVITATGAGNYDGSKGSDVFVLYPRDESDGTLVVSQGNIEVAYDGQNHLPDGFTVRWDDGSGTPLELTEADYELLYSYNNSVPMTPVTADTAFVDVGVYVVTVKAVGSYEGTATFVVTITPRDISRLDVVIDETTYNAGAQTAAVTVTDGRVTLTEGVDYTVSNDTYTDANEEGYAVLITGAGNYAGSCTGRFIIHRAEITVSADPTYLTYGDPLPDISTVSFTAAGIYAADEAGVTVTLAWPTDLSAGTHELTAGLSGERAGNYTADADGALLFVAAKDMNGADSGVNAFLDPDCGVYTGEAQSPRVVVTDSKLGTTLAEDRDYTVAYEDSDGNAVSRLVEVGEYTVIVTGRGNYTGVFRLTYTILQRPDGGDDDDGGHGGQPITRYVIAAEAGRGGEIDPEGRVRVERGDDRTFRIRPEEGYEIADVLVDGESVGAVSRYTFENVRRDHTIEAVFAPVETEEPEENTGVSDWLNTTTHTAYLNGYDTGMFEPGGNMTRAEVAQMFYNLLLNKNVPVTAAFTDVPSGAWYTPAVNALASLGILTGVGGNQYAPNRAITRAEFTVIAMRFTQLKTGGVNIFSDVNPGDWFYAQVIGAVQCGWIGGYDDGTFRPNNPITRAEVTVIVNRMLERCADPGYIDSHVADLRTFADVTPAFWAYYDIMEATNTHVHRKSGGVETWFA